MRRKNRTKDIIIENAIILNAEITTEDGFLTSHIILDYGCSQQMFGGHTLYLPKSFKNHSFKSPNYAGLFIHRLMEIVGVSKWSDLKGKPIRVRHSYDKIYSIGHIIHDVWLLCL